MNDHEREQWLQANYDYLNNALSWLHLRLERLCEASEPAPIRDNRKTCWFKRIFSKPLVKKDQASKYKDIAELAEIMAVAENAKSPPALITLGKNLDLTRFDREVLLLCVAMELDSRTATLCAKAQNNHKPYPTFTLARALFDPSNWDGVLSALSPLRYWQLLEINQPGAEPLTTSALRADEHIVNYLLGIKLPLDDRLLPFVVPQKIANNAVLANSQLQTAHTLVHYLKAHSKQACLIIQLTGADTQAKLAITHHALSHLGWDSVRFPLETLPTQTGELENFLRLWERERQLLSLVMYLDAHQTDESSTHTKTVLQRLLANSKGIVILSTRDLYPDLDSLSLEINKPTAAEQQIAWHNALGATHDELAAHLAGQFNLNIATITQISKTVLAEYGDSNSQFKTQLK